MVRSGPDYVEAVEKREVVIRPSLVSVTGKVFCSDLFDDPSLKWYSTGSTDSTINIVTGECYSGCSALKVTPPDGASKYAIATRRVPLPESKVVGLEAVWSMDTGFDGIVTFSFAYYDGSLTHNALLRWNAADNKWYYYSEAGNYTILPDATQKFSAYEKTYQRVKIIADFGNDKYVHMICNELFIDMSALGIKHTGSTTISFVGLDLTVQNGAGETGYSAYFDSLLMTEEA